MSNNIFKIWGQRRRLLLTDTSEIDLLYIKKDCFCSNHFHNHKINRFVVISGKVQIQSEYGEVILKANESLEIRPKLKHRFFAIENSVMVELAFVKQGTIDSNDIIRLKQGGRIIDNVAYTLDEMEKRGMLELWDILKKWEKLAEIEKRGYTVKQQEKVMVNIERVGLTNEFS